MDSIYLDLIWWHFSTPFSIDIFVAAAEKKPPEALIFQLPPYKRGIIVADTEVVYNPGGFRSAR